MSELDPGWAAHTPAYSPADLTNCDREPIHVPGAIQPHGFLLALDEERSTVVVASANTRELLGKDARELLGHPLSDAVGAAVGRAVAQRVAQGCPDEPLVLVLDETADGSLAGATVDVRVHRSGSRVVVEVENLQNTAAPATSYSSVRAAMARLSQTASVPGLADRLTREVRAVTGFDRVMVYRFDAEWNGEVVAEAKRPELNSFLGLHYPATDIPAQARRLYTVNWTRLIADLGYVPVPLHPVLDPETGEPLDLSHATLRSVSPIHVEYLTNMGVTASMSISLIVDGRLWGLVACHHYSGTHRPNHDARSTAAFLGQVASQMFVDRERSELRERALVAQNHLTALTRRVSSSPEPPLTAVMADPALLEMFDAGGAALMFDGDLITVGEVPDAETLQAIAAALDRPEDYVTFVEQLDRLDPRLAAVSDVAAGALRMGTNRGRWMLFLRPELEHVVDWGGDPTNKQIAASEGPEVRLSPRKSFDKWRQVVRGRSKPWQPWEAATADALGNYLTGLLLIRSREQIAMAESLQRSVVLDRAPSFPGVEVAARYLPATSYQLGGDWWDAFELPDGRIALVVGDVAGHGVGAASAMTQLRTALRAYLYEGHSPAECLDRLDRLMDGLLDEQVATAVVAVVEAVTGQVAIASAGHPPPLLVTAQQARTVEVQTRPLLGLGIQDGATTLLQLTEGATLLLYTDGLIERRGHDLHERTERLRLLAEESYPGSELQAWTARLVAAHGGSDDDTTVLAVRRSTASTR